MDVTKVNETEPVIAPRDPTVDGLARVVAIVGPFLVLIPRIAPASILLINTFESAMALYEFYRLPAPTTRDELETIGLIILRMSIGIVAFGAPMTGRLGEDSVAFLSSGVKSVARLRNGKYDKGATMAGMAFAPLLWGLSELTDRGTIIIAAIACQTAVQVYSAYKHNNKGLYPEVIADIALAGAFAYSGSFELV